MKPSEFHIVYDDPAAKDRFFLFLENVFHLQPEEKFHALIQDACKQSGVDEVIYKDIFKRLPSIKPFHAPFTYALPALKKQKKEMTRQTLQLLGDKKRIKGCIEIGSTGRYVSDLGKKVSVEDPIYLINEFAPSYSPDDIMERGSIFKLGKYIALGNYKSISQQDIPDASVDLVTCFIGLHHCSPERLDNFISSINRVLRPGGTFILRDHDVRNEHMSTFVSLVHTVFNAGTNVTWETEAKDYKKFKSVPEWITLITAHGFADSGKYILQDKDPSLNTLMGFVKK